MENIFLKGIKTPQKVIVFGDYQIYNDTETFKEYKLGDTSGRSLASFIKRDGQKEKTSPLVDEFIMDIDAEKLDEYNQSFLKKLSKKMNVELNEEINSLQDIADKVGGNLDDFKDYTFIGINESSLLNVRAYDLEEAESLYTELAKLTPFDNKGLLKFSKVFGLPFGVAEDVVDWAKFETNEPPVTIPVSLLTRFHEELIYYRYLFDMFKNVKLQNIEELKRREDQATKKVYELLKKMAEDVADKTGTTLSGFPDMETGIANLAKNKLGSSSDEKLLLMEKQTLASRLYGGKKKLQIELDFDHGKFVPKIYFFDLFEYAYFQIMTALVNDAELRECEYCGHVFEVTYEGRRFCPPLPFRKRSSCEMAYNNRRRKENK